MRRRIRFSLRTLLLLTLTAAFGMVVASRQESWPQWMTVPVIEEDDGWADFKFSPDESKLLVWSQNYMQIWDLRSKSMLGTFTPPVVMTDCDWVGEWGIAFASLDGRLRVYNLNVSAVSEYPKRAVPNIFQQVEASADGTRVMFFPGKREGAELWDLRTGRMRGEFSAERFSGFSLDGRHFLLRKDTETLQVRDSEDGKVLAEYARPKRVLVQEGWTWEPGIIKTAEVEYVDGGVDILPDGRELNVVEQKFWDVQIRWANGKLEEVGRKFNVGIVKNDPAYDVMTKLSRRGTAPDGRTLLGLNIHKGEGMYPLAQSGALPAGSLNRSDFSPKASYVAFSQNGASPQRITVWQNRRPEAWWGIVWLPECWGTIACLLVSLFSLYRDRKSHAGIAKRQASAAANESIASPVQTSPAKAV